MSRWYPWKFLVRSLKSCGRDPWKPVMWSLKPPCEILEILWWDPRRPVVSFLMILSAKTRIHQEDILDSSLLDHWMPMVKSLRTSDGILEGPSWYHWETLVGFFNVLIDIFKVCDEFLEGPWWYPRWPLLTYSEILEGLLWVRWRYLVISLRAYDEILRLDLFSGVKRRHSWISIVGVWLWLDSVR